MNTLDLDGGIAIDDADAPEEGSDAGSAADMSESRVVAVIDGYRAEAEQQFSLAKVLLTQDIGEAEKLAQDALSNAVKAFWWAEARAEEEPLHQLLHEIGQWKRQHVGCQLDYDEAKGYTHTCLVAMAHRRMGLSIGFIGARICSLCDQDLSECPHVRSRSYWMRGGSSSDHRCRVCWSEQCDHRGDRLYRAPVIGVIQVDRIREVSLVSRPASPEARILAVSVSTSELVEALGDSFVPGMTVSCDVCLGNCPGFVEIPKELDLDGRTPQPTVG